MRGGILIVRQNGKIEQRELNRAPTGQELHDIINGYLEVVPYWNSVVVSAPTSFGPVRCVAFCDEDGKTTGNKLPNAKATLMWDEALQRDRGETLRGRDHLVGDIAVVWGDRELLADL
jgi:hypothetical protein